MKRVAALSLFFLAVPALAHGGAHQMPDGPPGWTLDPSLLVPLAAILILYAVGLARLHRRSRSGRAGIVRSAALFGLGWMVLASALCSPLHEAGERSFTMHMIEHELIMMVASLLLVLSRPAPVLLWGLPQALRAGFASIGQHQGWRSNWRFLADPVTATVLQAITLWAWHAPPLFDRALGHSAWHMAQHLSFLATALLFWWAMAHNRYGQSSYGVSALCLFVTSLIGGLLGALMSFSASPWYESYAAMGMTPLGMTPLEDQQVAGLLMWIPGGLVHAVAALFYLNAWFNETRNAVAAE